MSTVEDSATALAVVEPASQLITIEPTEYVKQVFEPFVKRLADAKKLALSTTYDVKTTAGMATAVKIRATFRDIRVESEKARKIRKAPILEIGKLLDGRQKEIETEIEPLESAPDLLIKAEEKRKDDEKIAKALAESQRVTAIRQKIEAIRNAPQQWINKPSADIGVAADHLSETVITLDEYMEYVSEAIVERDAAVKQLRTMQEAMRQHEAEQQRLADERAALARDRAAAEERERVAAAEREAQAKKDAAARAEQEARDRKERARVEAQQQAANAAAQRKLDEQRRENEQQQAEQQAILDKLRMAEEEIHGIQHQVIIAQSGRAGVRQGGTIECLRDTLAETEAWVIDERFGILRGAAESAKTTAVAEIRRLLIEAETREAAEAEERRRQEEAEEAERIEAARVQAAKDAEAAAALAAQQAAEAEAERRERVNFIKNGPAPEQIILALADEYRVDAAVVRNWLALHDWKIMEVA